MTLLKDIRDKMDATPGLPSWEFGVRRYAVEMFEQLFEGRGLNPYSTLEELGDVTEEDLLNGAETWDHYSRIGNAFVMCQDISMRLFGKKLTEKDCISCSKCEKDLLGDQGRALEEASKLILSTLA